MILATTRAGALAPPGFGAARFAALGFGVARLAASGLAGAGPGTALGRRDGAVDGRVAAGLEVTFPRGGKFSSSSEPHREGSGLPERSRDPVVLARSSGSGPSSILFMPGVHSTGEFATLRFRGLVFAASFSRPHLRHRRSLTEPHGPAARGQPCRDEGCRPLPWTGRGTQNERSPVSSRRAREQALCDGAPVRGCISV